MRYTPGIISFGKKCYSLVINKIFLLLIILSFVSISCASENLEAPDELYTGKEYKSAFSNSESNITLPNVLLIGDSISIGYTVYVRNLLKEKANVHRIKGNGKDSSFGDAKLKKWIANKKWDIIHFNWGLWDICYRNPKSKMQGDRDKINGTLTTSPEQYRKNMENIVLKLKSTGVKLIWCTTTPVPEHEAGRFKGDEVKYNQIAAEIMKNNDIHINDLYSHALKKLPDIRIKKGDVHFTETGYKYLAEKVAREIASFISVKTNKY